MWALGIIAHEVLTGTPVAAPPAMRDEIAPGKEEDPFGLDAACAHASGAAAGCDLHQLLGPLAPTVYQCLSSEPSLRPSASEVLFAWRSILAHINLSD
jgi:hypothetical protein